MNKFKYFYYHKKNFIENFEYESKENIEIFKLYMNIELEIKKENYRNENILLNKLVVN